jgi:hypothetical protein
VSSRGVQDWETEEGWGHYQPSQRAQTQRPRGSGNPWDQRPREMIGWAEGEGKGQTYACGQARASAASSSQAGGPIGQAGGVQYQRQFEEESRFAAEKGKGERPCDDTDAN